MRSFFLHFFLLAFVAPVAAGELLISGVVTDMRRHGLEGVEVASMDGEEKTLTNEEGKFQLAVPQGVTLRLSKEGYVSEEHRADAEGSDLTFGLVRAAGLTVQVQDRDGVPLNGAEVAVFTGDGEETQVAEGRSSGTGEVEFRELRPGLYRVRASAEGYAEESLGPVSVAPSVHPVRLLLLDRTVEIIVSGRVVDAEDRPLPEARVGVLEAVSKRRWAPRDLVEVEEDGGYSLTIVRSVPSNSTRRSLPFDFEIVATHPRLAPAVERLHHPWESGRLTRDLRLKRPARVRGRLEDEDGRGVPGISIRAEVRMPRPDGSKGRRMSLASLLSATEEEEGVVSGEGGAFEIEGLPAGWLMLRPWRRGWPRMEASVLELTPGETKQGVVLDWRQGSFLEGEVWGSDDDRPLAGARVARTRVAGRTLQRARGLSMRLRAPGAGLTGAQGEELALDLSTLRPSELGAVTDEEGRFRLGGLEADEPVSLWVTAEGYGPEVFPHVRPEGEALHVRLRPSGAVRGRLIEAETGQPVSVFGLRAEPVPRRDEAWRPTVHEELSSKDGSFRLDLPRGAFDLEIYSEGSIPHELEGIEVVSGRSSDLGTIFLKRGYEISGSVRGVADGSPVGAAEVEVDVAPLQGEPPPDRPPGKAVRIGEAVTDQEGRFRISGLPKGEAILTVHRRGYADHVEGIRLSGEEKRLVRHIELGPGAEILARFEGREGTPLSKRVLELVPEQRYGKLREAADRVKWTGPDGVATFSQVPPGRYRLEARKGFAEPQTLEVHHGDGVEVVLQESGVVLKGVVRCSGGPPATFGIEVNSADAPKLGLRARSRGEEGYRLGPLSPGRYELLVTGSCRDGSPKIRTQKVIEVQQEDGTMVVDLEVPVHRVHGRLVRADSGEGLPRFMLVFHRLGAVDLSSSSTVVLKTGEDGGFEAMLPEPGRYQMMAQPFVARPEMRAMRRLEQREVVVPPGGRKEPLVLRLMRDAPAMASIRVQDRAGRPVAKARVSLLPEEVFTSIGRLPFFLQDSEYVSTDADGRAFLESASGGTWLLYVTHPDHAPSWNFGYRVGAEEDARAIVLSRGGFLEIFPSEPLSKSRPVRINLRRAGFPVPIRLDGEGPKGIDGLYTRISHEGTLLVRHLPAGTWTVEESLEDRPLRRSIVEIEDGGHHVLDLSRD